MNHFRGIFRGGLVSKGDKWDLKAISDRKC